jgi:hypothetical protein
LRLQTGGVGRYRDQRVFGGCNLNRPIDQLVTASGLELTRLDTYYMKGPRAMEYTFEGIAVTP